MCLATLYMVSFLDNRLCGLGCGHCKHLPLYIHDCMFGEQQVSKCTTSSYMNRSPSCNYVTSCSRFKFTQKHKKVKINEYRGVWAILVQLQIHKKNIIRGST